MIRASCKMHTRHLSGEKPNPSPALLLLPRVLCLGLLSLRNLALQYRLRHPPLRRISIRAPRMNRVHADIQDVPTAESA